MITESLCYRNTTIPFMIGDRVRVSPMSVEDRARGRKGTITEMRDIACHFPIYMDLPFDGWGKDGRIWGVPFEDLSFIERGNLI